MSIKEQMGAAKAYIQAEEYEKARGILKDIKHPTAEKWLDQLNRQHPPKKLRQSNRIILYIILIVIFALIIAWLISQANARTASFNINALISHIL